MIASPMPPVLERMLRPGYGRVCVVFSVRTIVLNKSQLYSLLSVCPYVPHVVHGGVLVGFAVILAVHWRVMSMG